MEDCHISRVSENIRRRLHGVPSSDLEFSIFRVRGSLHHGAYAPHKVSISPLHHGKEALQEMENHKISYLHSFMRRNPDMMLEDYLKAVQGLQAKTRRCYEEKIRLNDDKLSEMMLVDGCFVIELLVRYFKIDGAHISPNDPVFGNLRLLNHIRLDLLVIENQLPFFVLQCLFNITTAFNKSVPLVDLALGFFNDIAPGHKRLTGIDVTEVKHLLDLLRRSYAPLTPIEIPRVHDGDVPRVLKFGANKLQEVGFVKFKKCESRKLLDIKFYLNTVMEIPVLKIQKDTECVMRNFIAFEQSCGGLNTFMSDYMCFMASLMKSRDDVILLKKYGILETEEIKNEQILRYFEALTDEVIFNGCHYSGVCKKVEIHCASSWRLWLASLCQEFIALMVQVYHYPMSDSILRLARISLDLIIRGARSSLDLILRGARSSLELVDSVSASIHLSALVVVVLVFGIRLISFRSGMWVIGVCACRIVWDMYYRGNY